MLSSATKRKIDTARDILVGKIPMPTSQVEQITLALIYKFMSDMDKKTKDLGDTSGFFANGYEKYAWDNLMDKALPARDRVLLYRDALEKMALNPHIPQLFRDIFRNASLPFNDPETLKLFLDVIDQFEYDHSEELGNAFEYLLQVMGSQGDAGQFRTPRHIIDFIVEVVDPQKTDTVLDPACGTAGFLISAYKHLRKNGLTNEDMEQVSANFVGYDISQDMQRLSLVNMYLHHFPDPHIYEYDSLSSEDRWNDDFDVILANPPFMTPKGGIRPHNRFSVPSNRAEVLFVDYIMEHLTINGKAGVIVPEGIIFQSQNAYKSLRKMMVDNDYLWAVVSLPSGIFQPYSGVKTSVLLFDRQLAKKTNKILFVKVENDGFDLGAQRRVSKNNDLPETVSIIQKYRQELLSGEGNGLHNIKNVEIIDKAKIRESEYNLSVDRYDTKKVKATIDFPLIELGKLITLDFGERITKSEKTGTKYPVYGGGGESFRTDSFNRESEYVIARFAMSENCVRYVSGQFWMMDSGGTFTVNDEYKDVVNKDYIGKILLNIQNDIFKCSRGGAQKNLNKEHFYELEIPLPPLSVQHEIVEELDRYQKIIGGAKQVVDNYQPSFKIRDDWEWVDLGSLVNIKTGKLDSNASVKGGKYPFFTCARETYEIDSYSFDTEAVLLAGNNASGDFNVKHYKGKFDAYQRTYVITIKDEGVFGYRFLYYWLDKSLKDFKKQSIGTNTRYLRLGMITGLKIPLPSLEEQERIVKVLDGEAMQVESALKLSESFERKIADRVNDIWGK